MSNPFATLFGDKPGTRDDGSMVHSELSNIFRITLNVEDLAEVVILPEMLGEEVALNASNVARCIQQRMELTTPEEYLLNASSYKPKFGMGYLLNSVARLDTVKVSRQVYVLAEKALGEVIGAFLMKNKAISKVVYAVLMGKNTDMFSSGSSEYTQEATKKAIYLACLYGPPGAMRWIFSSFAVELREADLPGTSLLLYSARA